MAFLAVNGSLLFALGELTLTWVMLILISLPVVLQIFNSILKSSESERNMLRRTTALGSSARARYGIIAFMIVFISSVTCISLAFMARTGLEIVTVWEVVSPFFWIVFPLLLISLQYVLMSKEVSPTIKLVCISMVAFVAFGISFAVYKHGLGADVWGFLGQ